MLGRWEDARCVILPCPSWLSHETLMAGSSPRGLRPQRRVSVLARGTANTVRQHGDLPQSSPGRHSGLGRVGITIGLRSAFEGAPPDRSAWWDCVQELSTCMGDKAHPVALVRDVTGDILLIGHGERKEMRRDEADAVKAPLNLTSSNWNAPLT